MPSAAALRIEIERKLERKFPAALSPAQRSIYETCGSGISSIDRLLAGGFPVGAISEVTGQEASGRTTLAQAFVAERTQNGRPCAWVDVNDAFDPESAAANGVQLRRLLWVRCNSRGQGVKETRGRERQRTTERGSKPAKTSPQKTLWTRLDQGLRATDLLLQAGGFAAIVLDLGDTEPERANRIPLATWFRYRQAAERTQCCLVVVGKRAYAQPAGAMVLECEVQQADTAGGTIVRGFQFAVRRERERFVPVDIGTRKPPAATWQAHAAWNAERRA
jgi:recombination protein RecA